MAGFGQTCLVLVGTDDGIERVGMRGGGWDAEREESEGESGNEIDLVGVRRRLRTLRCIPLVYLLH